MTLTVDLSEFPGGTDAGIFVQGDNVDDEAGSSVSSAGDLNGDGFDDFIVGAHLADGARGQVYVVFGRADGFHNIDVSNLSAADGFTIKGGDRIGFSVSDAGDVNGDGFDDLIIGAAAYGRGGGAYVVFGHAGEFGTTNADRATLDLTTLAPDQGFIIRGGQTQLGVGDSVSGAGDLNGDGYDDLIVGASRSGQAYVIYGREGEFGHVNSTGRSVINTNTIGQYGFTMSHLVRVVSDAGDINGDGFDELILAAGSRTYVVYGQAGSLGVSIDLLDLTPAQGFYIDQYADSVSSAGDVNADGYDDIIIGRYADDTNGDNSGVAYVIFGHAGGFSNIDPAALGTLGFAIRGAAMSHQAGRSVSGAGDVNGDGYDDVIVGAPAAFGVGYSYVIYGQAGGFADIDLADLGSAHGFVIAGVAGEGTGRSVSGAGDVNGDGAADLLVGAAFGDRGGVDAGGAYLVFGSQAAAPVNLTGGTGDDALQGASGPDSLAGGDGNDVLRGYQHEDALSGENGDDLIYGNDDDDQLSGGDGADRLNGGGGDDDLDGGDGSDVLNGNLGADIMAGGLGDDVYFVEDASDGVFEAAGAGWDLVRARLTHTLSANVEELILSGAIDGVGNALDNILRGSGNNNRLEGLAGADVLRGGGGRDVLLGGDGDDLLDGGTSRDVMTGGAGRDVFQFRDGDMTLNRSLADTIVDFSHADADKIQLNLVDADTNAAGNQAFAWIGAGAFTGVAGELHYVLSGSTYVEGDTDGDGLADFVIALNGTHILEASDFVL